MSLEKIAALGPVEKVIEVRWTNLGRPIALSNANGILAHLVPGRNFVATLQAGNAAAGEKELTVFNADGSARLTIPSVQSIQGANVRGRFSWFETSSAAQRDRFSVIFQFGGDMRRLDIDAAGGRVTGVHEAR